MHHGPLVPDVVYTCLLPVPPTQSPREYTVRPSGAASGKVVVWFACTRSGAMHDVRLLTGIAISQSRHCYFARIAVAVHIAKCLSCRSWPWFACSRRICNSKVYQVPGPNTWPAHVRQLCVSHRSSQYLFFVSTCVGICAAASPLPA